MIIKHTKRNVIHLHERLIATKHMYNGFLPIFLCSTIVFFIALVVSRIFDILEQNGNYYRGDRITIVIAAILLIGILCGGIVLLYRKNKVSPYKRMIYDTKFKWFRVYYKSYYHIIRPSDIVRIKPKKIYKYHDDEGSKIYGFLKITVVDYSKAKNIYKTIKIYCTNPFEARILMHECIEEKLQNDFRKVYRSRKVAKIQSTRIKYQQTYEKSKEQIKKEIAEIKKKEEPVEENTSFNAWD